MTDTGICGCSVRQPPVDGCIPTWRRGRLQGNALGSAAARKLPDLCCLQAPEAGGNVCSKEEREESVRLRNIEKNWMETRAQDLMAHMLRVMSLQTTLDALREVMVTERSSRGLEESSSPCPLQGGQKGAPREPPTGQPFPDPRGAEGASNAGKRLRCTEGKKMIRSRCHGFMKEK